MSSEDIISELVQSVKELSEKNYNLAVKVNQLEIKVQQTDENKNDIGSMKTSIEAANTDRTSIKELLNLKVTETKNGLEEKVNSFKNDLAFLKEDLNNLDNKITDIKQNITSVSSQMEAAVKKISDDTNNNFETLKNDLISKISTNSDTITTLQSLLETNNKEVTSTIQSMDNQFQEKLTTITNQIQSLETSLTEKYHLADKELNDKIDQSISKITTEFNEEKQVTTSLFEKTTSDVVTELQSLSDNVDSKIQTLSEAVDTKLQGNSEDTNQKVDNVQSLISNLSSQTDMSFNTVKSQINKFFDISDNHSEVLKAFEEIVGQIHTNLEQASLQAKQDQELMLGSFQKIIVGQAENLRNELLTFSKEIRTNLSKFNEDTASKFTSIDETNKINEKIKALDSDLHAKSENIRKSVIETLDENVQKFNNAIKESISSVDEYRVDLERFKDDIESLIERKVNEKTEFSMELFNNLLTKAEHMTKLIQDSKITKVPQIAVPIPEIKNSERTTE